MTDACENITFPQLLLRTVNIEMFMFDYKFCVCIAVVFIVLVPGLRKHGILQKVTSKISVHIKRLLKKEDAKAPKSKTN